MFRLLPVTLAILGLGMFALSFWFQEAGQPVARWSHPAQPVVPQEYAPAAEPEPVTTAEGEPDSLAVTTKKAP